MALNHALFGLIRQYQSLMIIKKEIEPFKDDPIRYMNAPALSTNEYRDIKIHVEAIDYFLGSKEPALLMEIMLEHERFEMVLKSIEFRSKTHVNKLQPEMDRCQLKPGDLFRLEDFEARADFLTLQTIKNETEQMYEHVFKTCDTTFAVLTKLRIHAKSVFPEEKFVRIA